MDYRIALTLLWSPWGLNPHEEWPSFLQKVFSYWCGAKRRVAGWVGNGVAGMMTLRMWWRLWIIPENALRKFSTSKLTSLLKRRCNMWRILLESCFFKNSSCAVSEFGSPEFDVFFSHHMFSNKESVPEAAFLENLKYHVMLMIMIIKINIYIYISHDVPQLCPVKFHQLKWLADFYD